MVVCVVILVVVVQQCGADHQSVAVGYFGVGAGDVVEAGGFETVERLVRKGWHGGGGCVPEDEVHADGCGVEFGDAFGGTLD
jgi:hypothetical protein